MRAPAPPVAVQGQAWGGCPVRAAPQALIAGLSYRVFPLLAQPFGWAFCLDFGRVILLDCCFF